MIAKLGAFEYGNHAASEEMLEVAGFSREARETKVLYEFN